MNKIYTNHFKHMFSLEAIEACKRQIWCLYDQVACRPIVSKPSTKADKDALEAFVELEVLVHEYGRYFPKEEADVLRGLVRSTIAQQKVAVR